MSSIPRSQAQKSGEGIESNSGRIYGKLRSRNLISLSSEFSARIKKIMVSEGESFKKGAILVVLDCELIRAQHAKTLTILESAKSRSSIEKRLFELNSTGEFDVKSAEADVQKFSTDLKAMNVRLSKCNIKAPFSGRVVEKKMGIYEYANVGKEIMKIIDEV